ncbi:acyl carrier protein [Mycobacterium sp. shizuoka-1]|uniref:acyl carrier protein n=1 Tax=Mycobacterium sp. shizuoka-1 TaxID=2039281 RepID=UPI0018EC612A|nr:acyl carrier protein [Mycobacterium sp. shizuoka-1]
MDEKMNAAIRSALRLDSSVDLTTLEYHESPGWDSVGHMALVAALELEFDCMLDTDEILEMNSYARITSIMAGHV